METFNEKIEKIFKENSIPIIQYSQLKKNKPAIGEGSFGKVYSGIYDGNKIALKKMKFSNIEDEFMTEILNEIQTMSIANEVTKQVPKFYGLWKGRKSVGLVIEFIEGKPLSNIFTSLSRNEKIEVIIQISKVLDAIHSKNMIHRDIKPENIIIGEGLTAFIIDFGICRIAKRAITLTMKPKGTCYYNAPETVNILEEGDELAFGISTKADIWSMGTIISEIFSGEKPWSPTVKNPGHITVLMIQGGEFPIPSNIKEEEIREIISQCTAYNPDDRPTAEEIHLKFSQLK